MQSPALPVWAVRSLAGLLSPATLFAVLSILFGTLILAVTPPLRGPDETAHFLRAYGIAQGDVVPSLRDAQNRKGIMMPAPLFAGFGYFERVRVSEKKPGFGYGRVFADYRAFPDDHARRPAATTGSAKLSTPTTFVRYEGSEGYSPAAYLPHVAAALVARATGLDFLQTFYLMRFAGLIGMTAVIAWAITLAGPLGWAFFAIAMLPAAIYGRSVINADGAALAFAMLTAALFLRPLQNAGILTRAATLLLSALSKPANLAFILLEVLRPIPARLHLRIALVAVVVLPAVAVTMIWVALGGDDAAGWRLAELTGVNPQEFNPGWKLRHMLANPLDFPQAVIGWLTIRNYPEFGRQIVGVLGLFDTVLRSWVYPLVAVLTLIPFVVRVGYSRSERIRLAAGAVIAALAYCFTVRFFQNARDRASRWSCGLPMRP